MFMVSTFDQYITICAYTRIWLRAWSHEPLASIASTKIGKKSLDGTHDAIVDVFATLASFCVLRFAFRRSIFLPMLEKVQLLDLDFVTRCQWG